MSGVRLPIISPIDGVARHHIHYLDNETAFKKLEQAQLAQVSFAQSELPDRIKLCLGFLDAYQSNLQVYSTAISEMIGKPLSEAKAEFQGMAARTKALCEMAPSVLADRPAHTQLNGFRRFVRPEAIGVVLDIAAWNYPLLVATNVIVPAVLAGNAVLIKHAPQTALVGQQFEQAFLDAGAPTSLVSDFMVDHRLAAEIIDTGKLAHISFTGSVAGGRKVYAQTANESLSSCGLELGGKDAALVLEDANISQAATNLVEGSFYNAGQSCCAVERIYVHQNKLDEFCDAFVSETQKIRLGDPFDEATKLGPVVNLAAARRIRNQADAAISAGAQELTDAASPDFPTECYLPARAFKGVDHSMELMREESFGPVIGIMPYSSEDEAVQLVNDSRYGLTASIWTPDLDRAEAIGKQLEVGTVLANRCDYVDPELPWIGVKESGLGCTLGERGMLAFTRPKSFHLREASESK